jgi:homoserine dehydrogenase
VRTHTATDAALSATIDRLRSNDAVRNVVGVMRVEGEGGS